MKVIGLTGGVGTGKSTVAGMFHDLGATVLDADRIAHSLMKPRTAVCRKIRAEFGKGVLTREGRIDRKRLGSVVFHSQRHLRVLCRIVHPAVRDRIQELLWQLERRNPNGAAVLDIPLLIESGPAYKTDALVVVSAPPSVAARRLKRRSGWSREEFERRSSFQLPLREKIRQADFVVNNGGSQSATRRQVVRIWKNIKGEGVHGGRKDD